MNPKSGGPTSGMVKDLTNTLESNIPPYCLPGVIVTSQPILDNENTFFLSLLWSLSGWLQEVFRHGNIFFPIKYAFQKKSWRKLSFNICLRWKSLLSILTYPFTAVKNKVKFISCIRLFIVLIDNRHIGTHLLGWILFDAGKKKDNFLSYVCSFSP